MAETSELERVYTIPLRRARMGTRSKRADRAVRDVRDFLTRHMKSADIWIAEEVNEALWTRGKFTVPSRIRVRATRFGDGVVEVTLPEMAEGSVRAAIHERQEKAAETPVLVPAAEEEEEHEHEEAKEARPVTEVAGIGPAMSERLKEAGIGSLAALAAATPEQVAKATGKSEDQAREWIGMATDLADATPEPEGEEPVPEAEGGPAASEEE